MPQAKQQVEVTLAAYEAGRADFFLLIDAQRTLQETQIAYHALRADYERGLSDVRLAVGGKLEERQPRQAPQNRQDREPTRTEP